jgi:hypothetical protein
MSTEGPHPQVSPVHRPAVSIIAAAPDETVPQGLPWESVHLPSLDTDEVKTWIAENRTGPVFVTVGVEIASKGTPALPVRVTDEEYHELLVATSR